MKNSNRRQFLASTAGAAVATSISGTTGLAETPRKMKIDLACGRIGVKANQMEAIDLAARHGFEAVVPNTGDLSKFSKEKLAEMKTEKSSIQCWRDVGRFSQG